MKRILLLLFLMLSINIFSQEENFTLLKGYETYLIKPIIENNRVVKIDTTIIKKSKFTNQLLLENILFCVVDSAINKSVLQINMPEFVVKNPKDNSINYNGKKIDLNTFKRYYFYMKPT